MISYCRGKRGYDKKGATSAKNKRYTEDHIALRIYECPICSLWHLTSLYPRKNEYKKPQSNNRQNKKQR